jgi:integrase
MDTKLSFDKKLNQYYVNLTIDGKRARRFAPKGTPEKEARAYLSKYLTKNDFIKALEEALELKKGSLRPLTICAYAGKLSAFKTFYAAFADKTNVKALSAGFLGFLRERKCSDKTITNYFLSINSLAAAAVEFGKTEFALKLKTQLRPEVKPTPAFTSDEIKILRPLIEARRDMSLYCKLQYFCFIRPGEIAQLKMRDFDLINGVIYVPANVSKNRKGAHVCIPPLYAAELSAALSGLAPDARIVKITAKHAGKVMRAILKEAGITGKTLYSWKHAGATAAYLGGVGIKEIQQQARHAAVTTTDIYLRTLGARDNRAAFASFAMM